MEVHHHSHSTPKRWKHYIWEFFMLFLAVFCGFLAENQREHFVEHSREKQFMQSLVEDLETDTAELQRAILRADSVASYADSAVVLLRDFKPQETFPSHIDEMVGKAAPRQVLINADRTATQLKAGNMRLIRNKNVSNMIMQYWKQIEESDISLDRYMVYRNASRELLFKLWLVPSVYLAGAPAGTKKPPAEFEIIDTDLKKWKELTNLLSIGGGISKNAHSRNMKQQLKTANELIALINKEYHLK